MIVVKDAVTVDIGSVLMNAEIEIMKRNVKGNARNILETAMIEMKVIESVNVAVNVTEAMKEKLLLETLRIVVI